MSYDLRRASDRSAAYLRAHAKAVRAYLERGETAHLTPEEYLQRLAQTLDDRASELEHALAPALRAAGETREVRR